MSRYRLQLGVFSMILIIQTPLLRLIYSRLGHDIFKLTTYLYFSLLIALAIYLAKKNRWNKKDLGIRLDNLKKGFSTYLLITALGVLGILVLKNLMNHSVHPYLKTLWHFKGLFIISSVGQEFLFRSYLIKLEKTVIPKKALIIFLNGFLFGFIHIMVITEPVFLAFFLPFLLGILLAYAYLKYPNLFLASISHAVLNYLTASFCFFSFYC